MRRQSKDPTEKKRRKAVLLAKQISKILSNYTCQYCGKRKPQVSVHSHHIYSEGQYRSMSADINNLISVCLTHHNPLYRTNEMSFHNTPREMNEWFDEKYPELSKELREKSKKSVLCDEIFWDKKIDELKKQLSQLEDKKFLDDLL